jgi:hypothetical protein
MRKINQTIYPLSLLIAVNTTPLESRLIYSSYSNSLTIAQLTFPNYSLRPYNFFKSQLNTLISSLKNNPSQVNNINDFDLLYNNYLSLQKEIATLSPSPELTKALDELSKVLEVLNNYNGVNNQSLYRIHNFLSTNWRNDPVKGLIEFLEKKLNILDKELKELERISLENLILGIVYLLILALILLLLANILSKKTSKNLDPISDPKEPLDNPVYIPQPSQPTTIILPMCLPTNHSTPKVSPTGSGESLSPSPSPSPNFVAIYNQHPGVFKNVIVVNPALEDVQRASASYSFSDRIRLEPSRGGAGNYIIVPYQDAFYLVPQKDFRPIAPNQLSLQSLFDCENYQRASSFELIEPAQVVRGDQEDTWELVQKGKLRFF